jgi:probable rRNA maturation factor
MSLDVDVSSNGVRVPISRAAIAEAVRTTLRAGKIKHALISIALLDRRGIARMNVQHLQHHGPTDVISFGFDRATPRDPVVGDVYIAPEVARENARARGVSVREELVRLIVHGTLHVLGHDHPVDESRERSPMWTLQERVVRRVMSRTAR